MSRSFRLIAALAVIGAVSACTHSYSPSVSFAPGNDRSTPANSGATRLVESPFRGVPSTGSELTSPPPVPGSPPTALR
jgi:hypothetical protein